MPLSTEQIEKLSTLFQSKEEADHNMAQSLVEPLCATQEDFESLFLKHKRHLNGGMPSFFGRSIVWAYEFYAQFEDSPLMDWETIDCRGFELEALPDSLDSLLRLSNLKRVYWDASKIHQLGWLDTTGEEASKWAELLEIGSLSELSLIGKQLTSLPSSIGKLTNLTELYLRDNELRTLPESIGNLTNLTKLNLSYNELPHNERKHIRSILPNCRIS